MKTFKNAEDFWVDRWRRKPDASGAKPMTYSAIQDRLTELMDESLLKVEGKKILDLGCGRGEILEWLVGVHGAIGMGVDLGIPAITYLQSRKLVQAIHGEAKSFRSPEKFDVVFGSFILQHMLLPEDVMAFYKTVLFHLAPRGTIVLVDTFENHPQPYTCPRPVTFHEMIWQELGLRQVDCRVLQPQEPHKKVLTLKRKRHGWEKKSTQEISGENDGPESSIITSLVPLIFAKEISEPLSVFSSDTELAFPETSPLPDWSPMTTETMFLKPEEGEVSIQASTDEREPE